MPSTTNRRPLRRLLLVPVLGVAVLSSVALSGIGTAYAASAAPQADPPTTQATATTQPPATTSSSDSSSNNPLQIVFVLLKPVLGLVTDLPSQLTGGLTGGSSSDSSTSSTSRSDSSGTAKTQVALPAGAEVAVTCQEQSAGNAYTVQAALPMSIAGLQANSGVQIDSSAVTGLTGVAVPNVPMCAQPDSIASNN